MGRSPAPIDSQEPNRFATNPEIRLRAVEQLAIVEFKNLTRGTGIDEPWALHSASSLDAFDVWPPFRGRADLKTSPLAPDDNEMDEMMLNLTQWINLNAEVVGFDSYTGVPRVRRLGE
jgi:hypothetical protein